MYHVLVTVHLLAAMTWLGGVLFIALVGAPALRRIDPPELRASLFAAIGMRFRVVGWGAVVVLLVTGTWLLHMRGWLSWAVLVRTEFWRSSTGVALGWKLFLVAVMLGLSLVHDVALSPARARSLDRHPHSPRIRRGLTLLARVGALAGIGVVAAAVRMIRP